VVRRHYFSRAQANRFPLTGQVRLDRSDAFTL
jgi:hypothetical protein